MKQLYKTEELKNRTIKKIMFLRFKKKLYIEFTDKTFIVFQSILDWNEFPVINVDREIDMDDKYELDFITAEEYEELEKEAIKKEREIIKQKELKELERLKKKYES